MLLEGQIGPEGSYKVDFVDGKIVVEVVQKGTDGGAEVKFDFEIEKLILAIADKTDTKWDNALAMYIIGLLK